MLLIATAGLLTASMSLVFLGGASVASAGSGAFSSKPTYGGTLTVAYPNDFATLDPAQWNDAQSLAAMQQIYDTLVEYDVNSAKLGPGLATQWTVSSNKLTYTFYLRNAKFSNGDPVTAQDVAFSLDRVSQPGANSPYSGFAYSDIQGFAQVQAAPKTSAAYQTWSSNPMPLSGIKVLGPHELSITLVHPEAYFLNDLALMVGGIQDPAVVRKFGPQDANNAYEEHAVGSGPFMLQSWTHSQRLVLVRNPYYWGHKAYLAKVVFLVDVSDQTAYGMFERGQIDLIVDPTTDLYQEVLANPATKNDYHRQPWNFVAYGYLNVLKPPFNNVNVRQALNYAVNKQELIKVALGGRGYMPNDGVLPPGMPGWVNSNTPYPYNLQKAKELLAKAGYPNGGISFNFYVPADSQDEAIAAVLQQDWKQIGVNINIKSVSTAIYWTQSSPPSGGGPQSAYIAGDAAWAQDYPDPSDFLTPLLTASGPANDPAHTLFNKDKANYNNPEVDKLVNEANLLPPSQDATRWKLYDEAQAIIEKDAPWIFEYFGVQDALIYPTVGPSNINLYLHPVKAMQLQYVWVAK